jgi:predicted dithiol-disulfide oxidoreductase (DUF899 family)
MLADEKELTKHYDSVNAERRRLSMVKTEKDYVFDGPKGKPSLKDLFEGRRQLIVYHLMFDPTWETHRCPGCTGWVDGLGDLSLLNKRDTTFVVFSRVPLAMLDAYKTQKGWSVAWFSSFGSDFNYDFHVTLDPKVAPAEYNYRNKAEMEAAEGHAAKMEGEEHGLSVFFRLNDDVFHTYSVYALGCESLKTPTASSIRHPMGGGRTLRTLLPVGLRSRPTDRSRLSLRRHYESSFVVAQSLTVAARTAEVAQGLNDSPAGLSQPSRQFKRRHLAAHPIRWTVLNGLQPAR